MLLLLLTIVGSQADVAVGATCYGNVDDACFPHNSRNPMVPIVASTGGLVDTVKEGITGFHMGPFNPHCEEIDPMDTAAVATTVKRAIKVCGTPTFVSMVQACMNQDFSWKAPARLWEEILVNLQVAGSEPGEEGEEIAPLAKENVATP